MANPIAAIKELDLQRYRYIAVIAALLSVKASRIFPEFGPTLEPFGFRIIPAPLLSPLTPCSR